MGPDVAACAATGRVADPDVKIASPRGVYRCSDGRWVAMSGSTDGMALRILEAIGQGHLADDPKFATNAARLAHDAELDRMIGQAIGGMTLDGCLALFRAKGVTVGPIYDPAQLLQDEHVQGRQCYVRAASGTLVHNVTPRLSATPGHIRSDAPAIGEHTAELMREAGCGEEQIQAMVQRGAIRCS